MNSSKLISTMRKKRKYFCVHFVTFCLMTIKIFLELELHIEIKIKINLVIISGRVNNRWISTNSEGHGITYFAASPLMIFTLFNFSLLDLSA